MTVLLVSFGDRLAGQDVLGGLLLGLVVVRVADQPIAHTVQHVDDVAERRVHLTHGGVRRGLSSTAPTRTGDVLARRPHLAGLVLNGLSVHVETARHRPHLVRVSQKTRRHLFLLISLTCLGLMRPAAKASPSSHPPAGVRVSTFTEAVLAACVPMPRPLRAPMRACVYGLLGMFAPGATICGATLFSGSTGAARTISGGDCAHPWGTERPPIFPAPASWAVICDPKPRICPEMLASRAFSLPS